MKLNLQTFKLNLHSQTASKMSNNTQIYSILLHKGAHNPNVDDHIFFFIFLHQKSDDELR